MGALKASLCFEKSFPNMLCSHVVVAHVCDYMLMLIFIPARSRSKKIMTPGSGHLCAVRTD